MAIHLLLKSVLAVDLPFLHVVALLVPLLVLYRLLARSQLTEPAVPWVGVTSWPFSGLLASIRAAYDFRHMLHKANNQYISANQPCVLSNAVTGPVLILPPSYYKWVITQPDRVLNSHRAQEELVAAQELLWYSPTPFERALHGKESLKWLAARVDAPQDDMMQEIRDEFLKVWGSHDQEWKEVKVCDSLLAVIDRVVWQLIVGKALGQRKDLWRFGQYITTAMFVIGRLSDCLPSRLRPWGALTMGLPVRFVFWRIKSILLPTLRALLADLHAGQEHTDSTDFLSWAVTQEHQTRATTVMDNDTADRICAKVLQLIVAMRHSTLIALSNTILLLVNSPSDRGYLGSLSAEVDVTETEAETEEGPGSAVWTKQRIARLRGINSALRESMRAAPLLMTTTSWTVEEDTVVPGMVDSSSGSVSRQLTLRKGTRVTLPAYTVQVDGKELDDPLDYNALRFVDSAKPLTTPSSSFMAWSVGRAACPGRHWAAMTMKLILAVVLSEYEMQQSGEREQPVAEVKIWRMGPMEIPDTASMLKVKRRVTRKTDQR